MVTGCSLGARVCVLLFFSLLVFVKIYLHLIAQLNLT